MAILRIDGLVCMALSPGAQVRRLEVALEDATYADAATTRVAACRPNLTHAGSPTRFRLRVDEAAISPLNRYLLTAQADVSTADPAGLWRYGVTQVYPWPAPRPLRLTLQRLFRLGDIT